MLRRVRQTLRFILCALVILGLVPGTSEIAETIEHVLHDRHMPHGATHEVAADAEHHDDDTDEHGCTPIAHHCKCCASQSAVPPGSPSLDPPGLAGLNRKWRIGPERGPPWRAVAPLVPPPIA